MTSQVRKFSSVEEVFDMYLHNYVKVPDDEETVKSEAPLGVAEGRKLAASLLHKLTEGKRKKKKSRK